MQYLVAIATAPDLAALEQAVQGVDPAALLDLDPAGGNLRIATWMTRDELGATLDAAGLPVTDASMVQLPSECCGGCGG